MKIFIDTEPCESCDFSPAICGREIEDCMIHPENKCGNSDDGYLKMIEQERNEIRSIVQREREDRIRNNLHETADKLGIDPKKLERKFLKT